MNYSELIEAIQGYLQNEEDSFVARLDDFVIQAEQTIYRRTKIAPIRQLSDGAVVLVAGTELATLPSNVLEIFSVSLKNAQRVIPPPTVPPTTFPWDDIVHLYRVDESYIREAYPDPTAQAQPYHYAVLNDTQIIVAPVPDEAYPLRIYYSTFPESIVTAGETWLGTNAEQCLLFGAIVNAYRYLKGEVDMFAEYKQAFEAELALLTPEGSDSPMSAALGTEP